MTFVSYAQNWEDVLLHRCFEAQETGFYVDLGAYDPVAGNVTKALYDRGWCGINVEPGSVFHALAAARPRDVNLRLLVLDRTGEAGFVEADDRGMSHIAEDTEAPTTIMPCDTLQQILQSHAVGRSIDFLKVDVEGAEGAIVRSTNWRLFRPRLMIFEATLPWSTTLCNQEWEPTILAHGYIRAYFDGINCFYVAEEAWPELSRCFQAPVNVLDQAERFDPMRAETAAELKGISARVEAAVDELVFIKESISHLITKQ